MHSLFSKAKSKQMTINGFPDFAAAMADLSKVHTTEARSDYDYQVTVAGGRLPHRPPGALTEV